MVAINNKEQWLDAAKMLNERGWLANIYSNIYHKDLPPTENPIAQSASWETIHKFLEKMWLDAPDKRYIHSWEGWGILCDLCSEVWVFED